MMTTEHLEKNAAQCPKICLGAVSLVNQLGCKIFFGTPHLPYIATDNKMVGEGVRRKFVLNIKKTAAGDPCLVG